MSVQCDDENVSKRNLKESEKMSAQLIMFSWFMMTSFRIISSKSRLGWSHYKPEFKKAYEKDLGFEIVPNLKYKAHN